MPFLKMHVIFSFVTFLVCFPFVREDLESSQLNLSKYFSSLLPVKTNPLLVKPWQFEEECSRSCPAQQLPLRGEAEAVPHCSGPPAPCAHSLSFFSMVSLSPVTISFHLLVHMLHCILGWPNTKSALLCLCMCDSGFFHIVDLVPSMSLVMQ